MCLFVLLVGLFVYLFVCLFVTRFFPTAESLGSLAIVRVWGRPEQQIFPGSQMGSTKLGYIHRLGRNLGPNKLPMQSFFLPNTLQMWFNSRFPTRFATKLSPQQLLLPNPRNMAIWFQIRFSSEFQIRFPEFLRRSVFRMVFITSYLQMGIFLGPF